MQIYLGYIKFLPISLLLCGILVGCSHGVFSPSPPHKPTKIVTEVKPANNTATSPLPIESPIESAFSPPQDVWQRIRNGYQLGGIENPRIDEAVSWFTSNESVIRKSSQRALPLLHHIVESIEHLNLPSELALIPLLETGYRVHARSPYGALGPWQFMPATGRQYGLRRTAYLDHRKDLVLSTRAALAYLGDLHRQFNGDWLLAIAAYNGGPGTVKKALRGKQQTFWDIVDRLPKETQFYVPKLLAAARIIDAPEIHETEIHSIPNETFFETIQVTGPVDFAVLETLEQWDEKTFRRLNGSLSSSFYGRKDKLAVHVPLGSGAEISARLLAAGPPQERDSFEYLVRRGDTLGALAIRFDVPIAELRRYNGLHGNNIRAGKKITIPGSGDGVTNAAADAARHIVKPGDSFWTLGRRYGISVRTLARHNGHAINKTLFPGQMLMIPRPASTASLKESLAELNYVVERGDSLWSIAKRFGVATADLKRWNPLIKNNLLRPGQKLLVQTP